MTGPHGWIYTTSRDMTEAGGVLASAPYQTLVASRFVKSPENSEQITCLLSQASKQP